MTPKWFDSEEHSEEARLRRQIEELREANESVAVCADHTSDITNRSGCVVCDLCRAEGDAAHYQKAYDKALEQIRKLEAVVKSYEAQGISRTTLREIEQSIEIDKLRESVQNWTDLYNEIILVVQDHPWRDEYKTKHEAIIGILRKTKEVEKC